MQVDTTKVQSYLLSSERTTGTLSAQEKRVAQAAELLLGKAIKAEQPLDPSSVKKLNQYINLAVKYLTQKDLLSDPKEQPQIYRLAVGDERSLFREKLSDIYRNLYTLAAKGELEPYTIPMILQDTQEAIDKNLLKKDEAGLVIELEGKQTFINRVAIHAMNNPKYPAEIAPKERAIAESLISPYEAGKVIDPEESLDPSLIEHILRHFSSIDAKERDDLLQTLQPHFKKVSDSADRIALFHLSQLIPESDRTDPVLSQIATLCNDQDFDQAEKLVEHFKKLDASKRVAALSKFSPS